MNTAVRNLKEEYIHLLESPANIAEVNKMMSKDKCLVKKGGDEKVISAIDKKVDKALLVTNARVATTRENSTIFKILPSLIDPLVSLMKVEKVPDSTYDMIGGLA